SCVRVEADTEHGETLVRRWRLEGATPLVLAERVRWQLDGWLAASASRPTGGLMLLRLAPEEVVPDGGRQLGFWGGDRALDDSAARALVRVQGLLGTDAVTTAVPTGGRAPAEQIRLVPFGDSLSEGRGSAPWPGRVPAPPPATVHAHRLPVEVA